MATTPKPPLNPLTANDLAGVQAGIDTAKQAVEYWDKCSNCQVDVSQLRAQAQAYLDFFQGVKNEFGQTGNV